MLFCERATSAKPQIIIFFKDLMFRQNSFETMGTCPRFQMSAQHSHVIVKASGCHLNDSKIGGGRKQADKNLAVIKCLNKAQTGLVNELLLISL
ncbi:MAG: hypothetical protein RBS34_06365 [Desulfofustis sp.]|nr:hypothetical protein [Desulfofustis sp.]